MLAVVWRRWGVLVLTVLAVSAADLAARGLKEIFDVEQVPTNDLDPGGSDGVGVFGYMDSHFQQSFRLRLRDTARLDEALARRSDAYRSLDAAILEELVLKGILGMSADDIAAKRGNANASIVAAAKLVAACPDGNDASCGSGTSVFGSG